MTGFNSTEFADQTVPQQIQVADSIQHLVLDELVIVAQTILIQDLVVIHHDRIVDTAPQSQVHGTQLLDVTHETESTGPADFLHKRGAGKVHRSGLGTTLEYRVIEVDAETDLEALERQEGCFLVAFFQGDFALDTDKALGCILLRDTC